MKPQHLLIPLVALAIAGLLYSGMLGSKDDHVVTGDLVQAAREARAVVEEKLAGVTRQPGRVQLSDEELRSLVLASLVEHRGGEKILRHSNGIGAKLVGDKLELRLLLNVAKMREGLGPEERELFERAVATSKMAETLDVALSLEGIPTTSAGSLRLAPGDTTVKLSFLALDLAAWAERVGYKRRDVERLLQFRLPGYKVTGAKVTEDGVELAIRRV